MHPRLASRRVGGDMRTAELANRILSAFGTLALAHRGTAGLLASVRHTVVDPDRRRLPNAEVQRRAERGPPGGKRQQGCIASVSGVNFAMGTSARRLVQGPGPLRRSSALRR